MGGEGNGAGAYHAQGVAFFPDSVAGYSVEGVFFVGWGGLFDVDDGGFVDGGDRAVPGWLESG